MLFNLGEPIYQHFKFLSFYTSRRDVRNLLINYLDNHFKFNEEEKNLIIILIKYYIFIYIFFNSINII